MHIGVDAQVVSRRELEARGWTRRMIKLLLTPTYMTENPECPKGSLMVLYDVYQVELVERTEQYRDMMLKTRTPQDREYATLKWAKNAKINLTGNIQVLALAESLGTQDAQTLVAFIRHKFSNYSKLMDICDKKFGSREGKRVIRIRILRMIARTYPGLRPGCQRQWTKWYGEILAF